VAINVQEGEIPVVICGIFWSAPVEHLAYAAIFPLGSRDAITLNDSQVHPVRIH
jgi:hypothetical protein